MKNNTINKKEIEKFSKIAEEWWNPEGKFKPLHKFNPIRISYIKENIIKTFNLENKKNQTKVIALRPNIIPKKMYANFFPIKAVSGSSFTLINF